MQPLLQHYDPPRALLTRIERDAETGLPLIVTQQHTSPMIDAAKRQAALFDKHAMRGRPRMVAEIPAVIYMRLRKLGITRDRTALLKWLSRRDAHFFRVDDGRPLA